MENEISETYHPIEHSSERFIEMITEKKCFELASHLSQRKCPLEIAWFLHVFREMPLDTYLTKTDKHELREQIRLLFRTWEGDEKIFFVQSGILSYFVVKAFCEDDKNQQLKEIMIPGVEVILKETFLAAQELSVNRLNSFFAVFNAGMVDVHTLSHFCRFSLAYYLTLSAVSSDEEVFRAQSGWKNQFCPPPTLKSLLGKMVLCLSIAEVQTMVLDSSGQEPTHWQNLLYILDAFLSNGNLSRETMRALLREETGRSTEDRALRKGIILMRQCSIGTNLPFAVSYGQWLQDAFTSCRRHPETLMLLLRVLSDLLPYEENVECLKVAVSFPFRAPDKCQDLYADYVVLLKTRIRDLEPRGKPEDELCKALDSFSETAKVPPFVLEMSLFQKQRFLNEFLPTVFKAREMSHRRSVIEKFIQALDRAGKLSTKLLEEYSSQR